MAKIKVLFVDDEVDFLEVMGLRIKGWGYNLIKASNGKDALDVIINKSPDIVIVDYIMPDMDGLEVLRRIRKINKKIPVIMFTAHPDAKSIKGAEKLGVSVYVPKLSVYSDVQAALKTALLIAEKKLCKEKR